MGKSLDMLGKRSESDPIAPDNQFTTVGECRWCGLTVPGPCIKPEEVGICPRFE